MSDRGLEALSKRVLREYTGESKDTPAYRAATEYIPDRLSRVLSQSLTVDAVEGTRYPPNIPYVGLIQGEGELSMQFGLHIALIFDYESEYLYIALIQGTKRERRGLGSVSALRTVLRDRRQKLRGQSFLLTDTLDSHFTVSQPQLPPPSLRTRTNTLYDDATFAFVRHPVDDLPNEEELLDTIKSLIDSYTRLLDTGDYFETLYSSMIGFDLWRESQPATALAPDRIRMARYTEQLPSHVRFGVYDIKDTPRNQPIEADYRGKGYANHEEIPADWPQDRLLPVTEKTSDAVPIFELGEDAQIGIERNPEEELIFEEL